MQDIIKLNPHLFLGSRLKRLGEQLQADVLTVVRDAGLPVQPAHYPFLVALDRYGALSVSALSEAVGVSQPGVTRALARLVELGLVRLDQPSHDRRQSVATLTEEGQDIVVRSRRDVWPQVEAAVRDLCDEIDEPLMRALDAFEAAVDAKPLHRRAREVGASALRIVEFSDALAPVFKEVNAQWIEAMFAMEATDLEVLDNPRTRIIAPGGDILFVEADGLGIVGACALQKTGEHQFELTKMGVHECARGRKAGEHLLKAIIARAGRLGAERLYLLTSSKCAAAIHLYEKAGFEHDANIMAEFGSRYERCNVAMLYRGQPPA